MESRLSPQRRLFTEAYAATMNATEAAVKAGYSAATAAQQGSRLLKNVLIQKYLTELLAKKSETINLTRENLLKELAEIALGPGRRDGVKLAAIKLAGEAIGLFDRREDNESRTKDRCDAVDGVLELTKKIS